MDKWATDAANQIYFFGFLFECIFVRSLRYFPTHTYFPCNIVIVKPQSNGGDGFVRVSYATQQGYFMERLVGARLAKLFK